MRRLATVVLLSFAIQSLSTPGFAASWKCKAALLSDHFVEEFNDVYQKALKSRSRANRVALVTLKRNIANRVVETCSTQGDCSLAGIEHAIAIEVARLDQKVLQVRAGVFLTATLTGSSLITRLLAKWAPEQVPYISSLVAFLTALLINQIGAPVIEPFTAAVRRKVFGMGASPDEGMDGLADYSRLTEHWLSMQRTLPAQFQIGRGSVQGFINLLQQQFLFVRSEETAVLLIAEFLVRMKNIYPEINPRDPDISRAVKILLQVMELGGEEFIQKIWERLKEFSPTAVNDPEHSYYEEIINAWIADP